MNILYHFRTRGTGAEAVHIAGISNALEKLGHRVEFSSPLGVDPRRTAGASPYRQEVGVYSRFLPEWLCSFMFELMELGYNLVAYWRIRRILLQRSCGLIYERHAFFLMSTALVAKQRGIPYVVEVNELVGDARVRKQPCLSWVARWCDVYVFRRSTCIVVVSPHLRRRIEALGIPSGRILVLPNAVDGDAYTQVADGKDVRSTLGLESALTIGFVGWFVAWHKLDLLLDAFKRLAVTRPQLRLVLVGDGPLRTELMAKCISAGVDGSVLFPGALPHDRIPAVIAAMDVCVVPHSNEYRSPIKLFEYMGQGRAVVAPNVEPVAAVIHHEKNGLLFDPGNMESFEDQLSRAVDNRVLRESLGAQARADVLMNHTWRANAQCVLSRVVASFPHAQSA